MRYFNPEYVPCIMWTGGDQCCRNDLILYNLLFIVDVFQEKIQCFQPLFDPQFNMFPFCAGDDTGNNVERKNTFNTRIVAVYGKSDPLVHEQFSRKTVFLLQGRNIKLLQRGEYFAVMIPYLLLIVHFIPNVSCTVVLI